MNDIFKEGPSTTSSKRVVGVIGAFVLFASLVASHFTERTPPEYQVNTVLMVTLASLGYTTVEKFTKSSNDKSSKSNTDSGDGTV